MFWPFKRRRPAAVDPRIEAYDRFRSIAEPTTQDAEALLGAWQFDPGEQITVYLVRPARVWRHTLLAEPDWGIALEDGAVLHDWTVRQVLAAVTKLAERSGIVL
jgi:hypothetical protein